MVTSLSTRARGGLILTLRKTFAFYDPETETLEILADPEPDLPDNRFNDGKCDRQGRLWAGTMGANDWLAETGALYRFEADRRVTRMQDRVKCSNGTGFPDGLTVDAQGFVWSAQPVWGRLVRYDPAGRMERIIDLPVSRGTSCIFGGADYRTLFVTTATETLTPEQLEEEPLAGSLLAFEPGMQGLPETPFAG